MPFRRRSSPGADAAAAGHGSRIPVRPRQRVPFPARPAWAMHATGRAGASDAHGEICKGECHAEHAGVLPDPSVARLQVPEPALHDEDVNGNLEAASQGKATFQPGQCASTIQANAASPSRAARIRSVRTCGDGSGGSQDGGQPDRRDGYAQGDGRAPQLQG